MSPSNVPAFPFIIRVIRPDGSEDDLDYDCQVTIFDGRNRINGRGNGFISIELPKGLYVVRLVSAGSMTETVVVHESRTDRQFTAPLRSSALPTSDARESHEYYTEPAERFSRVSTVDAPESVAGSSRLMIMFRTREMSEGEKISRIDLGSLQTPAGEIVSLFDGDDLEREPAAGWSVFSTCLKPGPYFLINEERGEQIVMPIHLFDGWDSLIFIPVEKRVHLERASLDMVVHDSGFAPNDAFSQKVDAAIQVLGKHFGDMPQEIRSGAIYRKFDHPLAGLIGACAHFQSDFSDEYLEAAMLRNLWKLMPRSPDVIGLLFLSWFRKGSQRPRDINEILQRAEIAFGENIVDCFPLSVPPMLRPTLDAIIAQSQETPDIIEARSWLETASISNFAAGPWAIFEGGPMLSLVMAVKRAAHNPLSHQKLYPMVKSVFAKGLDLARRADWEISKNATIKSIASTPVARELGRTELGAKLRDLQIVFLPNLVSGDDTVADVVSKIRASGGAVMESGVKSALPSWLLDMAQKTAIDGDIDAMARDLASRAQVPLRLASAALDLAKNSTRTSPSNSGATGPEAGLEG